MKKLSKNAMESLVKHLFVGVTAVAGVLCVFTYVKGQTIVPPGQTMVVPLEPLAALSTIPTPNVPELSTYVANKAAAIALGKTLFWEMQSGSDGVQACATCHFNAGADSRAVNQVSPGIKAGDSTFQIGVQRSDGSLGPNYHLHAGTPGAGFGGYHDGDFPTHKQAFPDNRNHPLSDVNDVVGSQGVFSSKFDKIVLRHGVDDVTITSDQIFSFPDPSDPTKTINTRRVEPRNTPSVVNAVFNYRNFWDGRARNICNGANPFGERDTTSHFFFAPDSNKKPISMLVRLTNSALCSQALGPVLSNFEMSADGRNFKDLGKKFMKLDPLQGTAETTPLGRQTVDPLDSVLGKIARHPVHGLNGSYEKLIHAAFKPQWWQSPWRICIAADGSETLLSDGKKNACPAGSNEYRQIEYNFSVFWGIAIQMYESTLRADQTPLDKYLLKQSTYTLKGDNSTNSFTFTAAPGVDPYTVSLYAVNPTLDASDQDVFAFDDGLGNIVGIGVTQGTINYATGAITLFFDLPPTSTYPIIVKYSLGPTPLTQAQLRGLQIFQTKGRCITCHGGPELTNASVSNVAPQPLERMIMADFNTRVYDNGFYNIGVRPASDDIGVGGQDGIKGLPLSDAANQRLQVCADPSLSIMVPGRPGEFIQQAPLSCNDLISNNGNMKVPGLRNVALTAPYFHNGGQLTLEQVVEFYNRGGDFPDGVQIQYLDPNIEPLGLTPQEKIDLVDFLRNGLTDQRTVNQQAPFDHPEIFLPNGHPASVSDYPVVNDPNHPGQATDLPFPMLRIPQVGSHGGPLPSSFLQNLVSP
jgi:cytochrome c peroxidase